MGRKTVSGMNEMNIGDNVGQSMMETNATTLLKAPLQMKRKKSQTLDIMHLNDSGIRQFPTPRLISLPISIKSKQKLINQINMEMFWEWAPKFRLHPQFRREMQAPCNPTCGQMGRETSK
jgi:hypothetical protein